jgi:hypothetical protein
VFALPEAIRASKGWKIRATSVSLLLRILEGVAHSLYPAFFRKERDLTVAVSTVKELLTMSIKGDSTSKGEDEDEAESGFSSESTRNLRLHGPTLDLVSEICPRIYSIRFDSM